MSGFQVASPSMGLISEPLAGRVISLVLILVGEVPPPGP